MKKILGLIILSLFFYNSAFAKSASVVIPNSSVEDVKSKLIDTHLKFFIYFFIYLYSTETISG